MISPEVLADRIRQLGYDALSLWKRSYTVSTKADGSYLTSVDLRMHEMLSRELSAVLDIPIVSEEETFQAIPDPCWIIDPIDGTGAFVSGIPTWSIAAALLRDGEIEFGVVYFPAFDWMLHSGLPDGFFRIADDPGQKTGGMGASQRLGNASDLSGDYEKFITVHSLAHQDYCLNYPGKVRSLGSCTSSVAYAITGKSLLAYLGAVHLWDIAPCLPMIRKAGAHLQDLSGSEVDILRCVNAPDWTTPQLVVGGAQALSAVPHLLQKRGPVFR